MNKFKVGDRIRCIDSSLPKDKVFTVRARVSDKGYGYGIEVEGDLKNQWWYEKRFELVVAAPTPHKHAELIKAWADGAEIECLVGHNSNPYWVVVPNPAWNSSDEYRVRVQPKPDYFRYARCVDWDKMPLNPGLSIPLSTTFWSVTQAASDNLKATFDGETGKLKAVEILA